jgi:hypothetical protein
MKLFLAARIALAIGAAIAFAWRRRYPEAVMYAAFAVADGAVYAMVSK